MEKAFALIKQLVADFKAQELAYLSPSYQESQVRQDFIDKFFTALGWDVTHTSQKNPYEQEVHIENKVHMAGTQRRADYAFFLAPNFRDPKFFVEAKKPSHDLTNADYYYQAIRYGWNANTPVVLLTDFEELHILDCRYKPGIKDILAHKIESYHYSDYTDKEKFSRIYWLFSREAVSGSSIEKWVAELPKPRGKTIQRGLYKGRYQPVDEAFLEELDEYRVVLAREFKKSNPRLQSEELTEAVQRTIDRLVFIRFLEDKQIEEPEIINLRSKSSAWNGFLALCKQLDPKYNGLVFKPHKILEGKRFIPPDDTEFVQICDELADPASPYNFDQIPVSILGSIYERFLGKIVHATDKRVKVEEKPEVRKAGGVYYTPEYIVRYIVNETVGKLIERKTPKEISQMAFADIACGSGSFLIEIYNQLLDYHVRYYVAHPDKQKETDVIERNGKLHLTLKKKKEILLNNIYGVDIDFQATEVTQLSLYLKLLEDVTMHDAHQFGLFKETILPDLRQNIVCGNSLVGSDIVEGQLFATINETKLKPMNFEDAFPIVMKRGGFDAVVGNPPWGSLFTETEKDYLSTQYINRQGEAESHLFFIEKAIKKLKSEGLLGYITPNTWLCVIRSREIREFILKNVHLREIDELSKYIFKDAPDIVPILIFMENSYSIDKKTKIRTAHQQKVSSNNFDKIFHCKELKQNKWLESDGATINLSISVDTEKVTTRCEKNSDKLENLCDLYYGIKTGDNNKFLSRKKTDTHKVKALKTSELGRYSLNWKGYWLWWTPALAGFRNSNLEVGKIIIQYIRKLSLSRRIIAAYDDGNYYPLNNYSYIVTKRKEYSLKYILGVLNSALLNYYYAHTFIDYNIKPTYLSQLPIRTIDSADEAEKSKHDHIVKLVDQMLEAKEKLSKAKTEAETDRLEMQCERLDRQIDEAVYELYGLTEEEIKIVEGE